MAALSAARVLPVDDAPWSDHSRRLVEAGEALLALGVDGETVARIARLGWSLASSEVDAVVAEVAAGADPQQAVERQAARRRALTRLIVAVRHSAVSRTVRSVMGLGDRFQDYAHGLLHVPSALFVQQHGLAERVAEARERAEAGDRDEARLLGSLLLALGRHSEANRRLEAVCTGSDVDTHLPNLQAHLALARLFVGDDDGARTAADAARAAAPDDALVLVIGAVVRAYAAGRAENAVRAAEDAAEALTLLARSRDVPPPESALDRVQAAVVRGRISLVMPPAFGLHDAAVDDLKGALTEVETITAPAGVIEIVQLHACWFLGQALATTDPTEASAMLRRVLVLDPACALAEQAYRALGELN